MGRSFNDIVATASEGVSEEYQLCVRERKDVYFDRWDYLIRDQLQIVFNTDSAEELHCLVTGEMNLLKRTINTISTIYKDQAERKLILSEETKEEGELKVDTVYDDLIKKIPYDLIMRKANQMTNLTNSCAIRTVWREGKIDYDVMTFDNLNIIVDPTDWKKIIGWCFFIGTTQTSSNKAGPDAQDSTASANPGRPEREYQSPYTNFDTAILYTNDSDFYPDEYKSKIIYYEQVKGGEATIQSKDGEPRVEDNPYKKDGETVLPFTFITKDYPVDYLIDYSSGNDLMDLTIQTAVRYVHMNNLFANQSWKQPYVVSDSELPIQWNATPRTTLRLPQAKNGGDTKIGLLDMQADLKSQWEVIVNMIKLGLAQNGIDSESLLRSGGNPESGFALEIRKEGLTEIRESQLPIYEQAEHSLFENTRVVYNHHAELEGKDKISEEGRFSVDFGEDTGAANVAEEDQHWLTLIREDIKSVVDWVKSVNPDIKTDDDAKKILLNNRQLNKRFAGVLEPVQQPQETEEEEGES